MFSPISGIIECLLTKRSAWLAPGLLATLLLAPVSVDAANQVALDIVKSGFQPDVPCDTIYIGGEYELRIWIENDVRLGGISMFWNVWMDEGGAWQWLAQSEGYGRLQCVTIIPGSRLVGAFDLGGLQVNDWLMDGISPDIFGVGGAALYAGVPPGPMEPMISVHFRLDGPWAPGYIGDLCVDSISLPPCGGFLFIDMSGPAIIPRLVDIPACWPVVLKCGNPNGDNDVDVADVVFLINYIFRDGPAPDPLPLGDANADGAINMGDITYLLRAAFRLGPQPQCPDYQPPLRSPGPGTPIYDANDWFIRGLCDSLFDFR